MKNKTKIRKHSESAKRASRAPFRRCFRVSQHQNHLPTNTVSLLETSKEGIAAWNQPPKKVPNASLGARRHIRKTRCALLTRRCSQETGRTPFGMYCLCRSSPVADAWGRTIDFCPVQFILIISLLFFLPFVKRLDYKRGRYSESERERI